MPNEQTTVTHWFAEIFNWIDSFFISFNINAREIISFVTYFGLGFCLGILFKKYGKWIVIGLIGAVLALALLSYYHFIMIHTAYIRCLLGLQEVDTIGAMLSVFRERLLGCWLQILIMIGGFLFGFKLG